MFAQANPPSLSVWIDSHTIRWKTLNLSGPVDAHWYYLGIYQTTDTNYITQLQAFSQSNQQYVDLLRNYFFSHFKVLTIYLHCYLPIITYLLPAITKVPATKLHKAQEYYWQKWVSNAHSLAITFAEIVQGGLRLCGLGLNGAYKMYVATPSVWVWVAW